jgi:hypothetical protein
LTETGMSPRCGLTPSLGLTSQTFISVWSIPSLLAPLPSQPTVAMLDEAAKALGMCRSDVIRRSPARDLGHVMSHEVPSMQRFEKPPHRTLAGLAASVGWANFTSEKIEPY